MSKLIDKATRDELYGHIGPHTLIQWAEVKALLDHADESDRLRDESAEKLGAEVDRLEAKLKAVNYRAEKYKTRYHLSLDLNAKTTGAVIELVFLKDKVKALSDERVRLKAKVVRLTEAGNVLHKSVGFGNPDITIDAMEAWQKLTEEG